jgi:hypothetical protein
MTSMPASRTITSKQLTFLFVALIAGPIACGLLLSYFTRKMPEPVLEASVRIESMWVSKGSDPTDRRLLPCVTVKNKTSGDWKNLSIGLDEQFYASEPKGIPSGQTASIPLEAFVARNGSVKFPVGNRNVEMVTVFAQIPNGSRAVSEFDVKGRVSVSTADEEQSWAQPIPR